MEYWERINHVKFGFPGDGFDLGENSIRQRLDFVLLNTPFLQFSLPANPKGSAVAIIPSHQHSIPPFFSIFMVFWQWLGLLHQEG